MQGGGDFAFCYPKYGGFWYLETYSSWLSYLSQKRMRLWNICRLNSLEIYISSWYDSTNRPQHFTHNSIGTAKT